MIWRGPTPRNSTGRVNITRRLKANLKEGTILGPSLCMLGKLKGLWMVAKSISHLRTPWIDGFPCEYQANHGSSWFQSGATWISSIHSMAATNFCSSLRFRSPRRRADERPPASRTPQVSTSPSCPARPSPRRSFRHSKRATHPMAWFGALALRIWDGPPMSSQIHTSRILDGLETQVKKVCVGIDYPKPPN